MQTRFRDFETQVFFTRNSILCYNIPKLSNSFKSANHTFRSSFVLSISQSDDSQHHMSCIKTNKQSSVYFFTLLSYEFSNCKIKNKNDGRHMIFCNTPLVKVVSIIHHQKQAKAFKELVSLLKGLVFDIINDCDTNRFRLTVVVFLSVRPSSGVLFRDS